MNNKNNIWLGVIAISLLIIALVNIISISSGSKIIGIGYASFIHNIKSPIITQQQHYEGWKKTSNKFFPLPQKNDIKATNTLWDSYILFGDSIIFININNGGNNREGYIQGCECSRPNKKCEIIYELRGRFANVKCKSKNCDTRCILRQSFIHDPEVKSLLDNAFNEGGLNFKDITFLKYDSSERAVIIHGTLYSKLPSTHSSYVQGDINTAKRGSWKVTCSGCCESKFLLWKIREPCKIISAIGEDGSSGQIRCYCIKGKNKCKVSVTQMTSPNEPMS